MAEAKKQHQAIVVSKRASIEVSRIIVPAWVVRWMRPLKEKSRTIILVASYWKVNRGPISAPRRAIFALDHAELQRRWPPSREYIAFGNRGFLPTFPKVVVVAPWGSLPLFLHRSCFSLWMRIPSYSHSFFLRAWNMRSFFRIFLLLLFLHFSELGAPVENVLQPNGLASFPTSPWAFSKKGGNF